MFIDLLAFVFVLFAVGCVVTAALTPVSLAKVVYDWQDRFSSAQRSRLARCHRPLPAVSFYQPLLGFSAACFSFG